MSSANLTPEAIEKARKFCIDEYKDYIIYKEMAEREKSLRLKEILNKLAEEEYDHYLFWSKLIGEDCKSEVSKWTIRLLRLSRKIFGLTFTLKFLELHEKEVIKEYKEYMRYLDEENQKKLQEIIDDEMTHESRLMEDINEAVVRYLSFIALGLADAIVEISGVHAGFLGATRTTLVSGVAGLIVGVSAAFAMAGAAYLQAKAELPTETKGRSPAISALITGVTYIFSVVLLALPYFLTSHQFTAFVISILFAILIVSGFTFYNSVISESSFKRELTENLAILFGTAFIAYLFGDVIGAFFGLQNVF